MSDRELTGAEAQDALSEAARTVRERNRSDAIALLRQLVAPCDGAHNWRTTCRRCTAVHGIEMRFDLSMRLLQTAIDALEAHHE